MTAPMKRFLFSLFGALALISSARAANLPPAVTQALKQAGIPTANVAVVVQETDARGPKIALHATQAMNPASTMKLLTTHAALGLLGPAYRWRTEAYTDAPLENGVLQGDLLLKGGGDPKLTLERFWLLLHDLRARGIREIRGKLLLDRSAFALTAAESSETIDEQTLRPYNVAPDALLLNYKAIRLDLLPQSATQSVGVSAEPQPANLVIDNRLRLSDAPCDDWREALRAELIAQTNAQTPARLVLSGDYPSACGEQAWHLSVLDHPHYLYGVFRQLWQELGGRLDGPVADGKQTPAMRRLAASESAPLIDIVRDINKYSNNVMARQLLLTLALRSAESGATPQQGTAVVLDWLRQENLEMPELAIENGAGLSRQARISAGSMAKLLAHAWHGPLMPEFVSSLPINAIDGTMQKRLKDGDVAGQAHLKTGTLKDVKTLAGYIRDAHGKWWIVVFLVNHPRAAAAQAAQDALVQWIYAH